MQSFDTTAQRRPLLARGSRRAAAIFTAVLFLLGGGLAYAYWSVGGSGAGTAAAGTNSAITVVQTSTVTGLAPGSPAQTLSGKFNNANTGPVYVANVVATIASVTKDAAAPTGTCDATDYTLSGGTMAVGAQVPAGSSQGAWSGATIAFNNKAGSNQDACKNATVNFTYTSN